MKKNFYTIEIVYIIFYFLLSIFIYFNAKAIFNFSKSNEIIIENVSPQCELPPTSLPKIDLTTLKQCTTPGEYLYNIGESNLQFIISEDKSKAKNFINLCKNYCDSKYYDVIKNQCNSPNDKIYNNCINLLEPSPGCANSSNEVATDENTFNTLYAVGVPENNTC